jgi:hypothetical protein
MSRSVHGPCVCFKKLRSSAAGNKRNYANRLSRARVPYRSGCIHGFPVCVRQGKSHLLQIQAVPFNEAGEKFLAWADVQHAKKPNTARRVRTSFASLVAHFGRTAVTSITAGDVLDYRAWRTDEHRVKDVTIRHDPHNLSKFFKYAIKHNWCKDNPGLSEDIPSDKDAIRMHIFTATEEIA